MGRNLYIVTTASNLNDKQEAQVPCKRFTTKTLSWSKRRVTGPPPNDNRNEQVVQNDTSQHENDQDQTDNQSKSTDEYKGEQDKLDSDTEEMQICGFLSIQSPEQIGWVDRNTNLGGQLPWFLGRIDQFIQYMFVPILSNKIPNLNN